MTEGLYFRKRPSRDVKNSEASAVLGDTLIAIRGAVVGHHLFTRYCPFHHLAGGPLATYRVDECPTIRRPSVDLLGGQTQGAFPVVRLPACGLVGD